jgi:transcriptional regulator with GAF, ATPase, and Fis domain
MEAGGMPPGRTELCESERTHVIRLDNAQLFAGFRRLAEEQAALRRVATLVARATPPQEVFAAVAGEVGGLLEVDYTVLIRSDPEDMITVVGAWTATGGTPPSPVGSRFPLGGRNVSTLTLRTGRPARLDAYVDVTGSIGNTGARDWGFGSSVGVPISVEGRSWGLILVAYTRDQQLPAGTEARLVSFTELVATAIASTQAQMELRAFAEEQAALRRVATAVARGSDRRPDLSRQPAGGGNQSARGASDNRHERRCHDARRPLTREHPPSSRRRRGPAPRTPPRWRPATRFSRRWPFPAGPWR